MDRRTLLKAGLVAPVAGLAAASGAAPAAAAPRRTSTLASGLNIPWQCDFLPSGNALVTLRDSGRVIRLTPHGQVLTVGTVPHVFHEGEGGLLGVAVSPTFNADRWVYLYHTTRTDNRLVRARMVNYRLRDFEVLLSGIPSNRTHNGGGLLFHGSSLFVTTGDARLPDAPQDTSSLAGKILRVTADGAPHPGNPFVGSAGSDYVYSYGHRNPQGITVGGAGKYWASELGANTWDELNQILPGRNYGWPVVEGRDGPGGFTDPLTQWHPANASPSGIAELHGRVYIGALRGEALLSVDIVPPNKGARARYFHHTFGRIRMVKRAPDDSLWIGTSNGGNSDRIHRIVV